VKKGASGRRGSPNSARILAGGLEVYLRHFPETLPQALGNHVASAYHAGPSGIYRYRPDLEMLAMRPHHEREMFFNGYRWRHRTDSMGFRNPGDRRTAHVVLLGDSMVYGHGLEEEATVRHQLEAILRRPVANWGLQGGSIHQAYQLLKHFGPVVRPRFAFAFFLANDVTDLLAYLSERDMTRFLEIPVEDHATPYFRTRRPRSRPFQIDVGRYVGESYLVRALDFLWRSARTRIPAFAAAGERWEAAPPFRDDPRLTLARRVHLRTLLKMEHLADAGGFTPCTCSSTRGSFPTSRPTRSCWTRSAGATGSGS
jgi:hypothetical protein